MATLAVPSATSRPKRARLASASGVAAAAAAAAFDEEFSEGDGALSPSGSSAARSSAGGRGHSPGVVTDDEQVSYAMSDEDTKPARRSRKKPAGARSKAAAASPARARGRPSKKQKLEEAKAAAALDAAASAVGGLSNPFTTTFTTTAAAFPYAPMTAAAVHSASAAAAAAGSALFPLPMPPFGQFPLPSMPPTPSSKMDAAESASGAPAQKVAYSRKDKSLGLLCENFLRMFSSAGPQTEICLDGAANSLGVERRRIYDIVNILESVDIVSRRGKNQYLWHGTTRLAAALQILQKAIAETGAGFQQSDLLGGPLNQNATPAGAHEMQPPTTQIKFGSYHDDDDGKSSKKKKAAAAATDPRKEQSLGHLSQVFVQMFLSNDTRVVSLDDAGKWLLGGPVQRPGETPEKAQANFKSRVRRLYDIANVFTSLELVEKVRIVQTRKPAFKWLGARVYPLASSVPRDAYTCDAPSRKPPPRLPGFDPSLFASLMPMGFFPNAAGAAAGGVGALGMGMAGLPGMPGQPSPPPIPRRATIDTAQLRAATPLAQIASPPPLQTAKSKSGDIPEALSSLQTSFEKFEEIKSERVKRTQFEVESSLAKSPTVKLETKSSSPPAPAAAAAPTRTSSFARLSGRTPSAVFAQHTSILSLASSGAATSFDPLLLAYARPPPTSSKPALQGDTPAALSAKAGFALESTAYIRDSTDFMQQYRSACRAWQSKIPAMKSQYLRATFAPPLRLK